MPKINTSFKHVQIDKANTVVVIVVAVAAFVLVFTGFAVNALLAQRSYQVRVIDKKETAREQLDENIEAVDRLESAYQAFIATSENAIGGVSEGSGERDGDNARLVLDSLPGRYDYPALVTSVEKILNSEDVTINEITGVDEEIAQQDKRGDAPIEMPYVVEVSGDYDAINELIAAFERSIRPFHVNTVELSGDDDSLNLALYAHSYYQPEKRFEVESEPVE